MKLNGNKAILCRQCRIIKYVKVCASRPIVCCGHVYTYSNIMGKWLDVSIYHGGPHDAKNTFIVPMVLDMYNRGIVIKPSLFAITKYRAKKGLSGPYP